MKLKTKQKIADSLRDFHLPRYNELPDVGLSLDGLINFIALQKRTYSLQKAYDYFCEQFENTLLFTAEVKDTLDIAGEDTTDEKRLLFSCIVAVTQKIYLERCLEAISQEEAICND